jgi:hypothetical protein
MSGGAGIDALASCDRIMASTAKQAAAERMSVTDPIV